MNSFIWNLIEINAVIILLFLGYLAVRNRLAFKQQRLFLIGIPFVAILAILIKSLVDFSGISYSLPVIELEPIVVGLNENAVFAAESPTFPFIVFYGLGAVVIGFLFVFRLSKLSLFFARHQSESNGKYRIYKVNGKASFSFFNRIQITPSLSAEEQKIVLEHEKMHADKKHSIDTVLIELLHVLFWFNPVFFFIKRELINLHEFEVDALMYEKHKVHYLKFLVNYALGLNSAHYLLTSRFYNQLTLKKRIKIKKKNIRKNTWLLSIIPLIGMAAIMFQCTKENDSIENAGDPPNPNEITLEEKVYDDVEVFPEFNGGEEAMINFIVDNVEYPKSASEEGVEGTVFVQFVVSSSGEIKKPVVMNRKQDIDERLAEEALRVVGIMPNWTPGENKGEKVAVKFTLPISFQLN
jgi:TonB family protein